MRRNIMKRFMILGFIICILSSICACGEKTASVGTEPLVLSIEKADTSPESEQIVIPSKEKVYSMREQVLHGMTEEEQTKLTETIKNANLAMESDYLYYDIFEKMADPEDLNWNRLEQTGEIQIGWGFDEEILEKYSSGMTYKEFENQYAEQYGTQVIMDNPVDADKFVEIMQKMQNSLQSDLLTADFDNLVRNMQLAKETHNVEYLEEVYHILHDMDYFLLRYGPEDVAKYGSSPSLAAKYFGALQIYKSEEGKEL